MKVHNRAKPKLSGSNKLRGRKESEETKPGPLEEFVYRGVRGGAGLITSAFMTPRTLFAPGVVALSSEAKEAYVELGLLGAGLTALCSGMALATGATPLAAAGIGLGMVAGGSLLGATIGKAGTEALTFGPAPKPSLNTPRTQYPRIRAAHDAARADKEGTAVGGKLSAVVAGYGEAVSEGYELGAFFVDDIYGRSSKPGAVGTERERAIQLEQFALNLADQLAALDNSEDDSHEDKGRVSTGSLQPKGIDLNQASGPTGLVDLKDFSSLSVGYLTYDLRTGRAKTMEVRSDNRQSKMYLDKMDGISGEVTRLTLKSASGSETVESFNATGKVLYSQNNANQSQDVS